MTTAVLLLAFVFRSRGVGGGIFLDRTLSLRSEKLGHSSPTRRCQAPEARLGSSTLSSSRSQDSRTSSLCAVLALVSNITVMTSLPRPSAIDETFLLLSVGRGRDGSDFLMPVALLNDLPSRCNSELRRVNGAPIGGRVVGHTALGPSRAPDRNRGR